MEKRIAGAVKLIKDIDKKIVTWNERSSFTLKKVKNLSRSDLDTLRLYAETFIASGGCGFVGLMKPLGEIAKVLYRYGIMETA